ncbi:MAG: ABC transporter permease, partial [Bifidobacteriaceae bacterium]|nr:ABC transporter permease [Bifidobacteriaceae bacterium]
MFFSMIFHAIFRRRSRSFMAVIASCIGTTTLFCLAAICIAVPQQMNEEMRLYGANMVVSANDMSDSSEASKTKSATANDSTNENSMDM